MKAKIVPILLAGAVSLFLLSSCEDSTYKEYKANVPVYLSFPDLHKAVTLEQNVELVNPGKVYFKDNYILIVEELKGIHVFDNNDPSSPKKKVFVNIPGVIDIVISGNILYADSFVDLVMIDLQDIDFIKEAGRIQNFLPYTLPPTENDYPKGYVDQNKGVVLSWELKTIREKVNTVQNNYPVYFLDRSSALYSTGTSSGVSSNGVGIGGSMSRFGIRDNILYLLEGSYLKIIDISFKTKPYRFNDHFDLGANAETMFLKDKKMFLGTTTGMVIYDLTNPYVPGSRVFFTHARSCDPVIVDDTLAYVTLRTGTTCGGNLNNLVIVNVKDLAHPSQVISYPMTNPHGLGKNGNILFVCDGSAGLKIFNATNPKQLFNNILKTYPGINAYDVIPLPDNLIMVGDSGLYQYDYSDILNITLRSKIGVVPK